MHGSRPPEMQGVTMGRRGCPPLRGPCAVLLALVLGGVPTFALATEQEEPPAAGAQAAPSHSASLVPPTPREDSLARLPEGLQLTEPVVVELELTVDEAGDVTEARLVGDAPAALAAAALHAATRLRFHPATSDGVPVAVRLPFTYRFEPPVAQAPRALLTGRVRQKGTRKPIAGATVQAGDATAETDAQGLFQLELPPGSTALKISAPGHRLLMLTETLAEHQRLEVLYALEPLSVNPYETVVRADRPRTEVSRVTLHDQELREVPGTMGDPFRVVMLMPGVTALASGLSYPVVRGVQPAASAFYVDGVRVPFLYHLLVGSAVVHPDLIDTLDFQVGVPSARYGSLLGGAVDAHISRPREQGLHGTAYVDLIHSGAFIEAPFPETGTTVTAAARVSYTGLIVTRVVNAIHGPETYKNPDGTVLYTDLGEPKIYADYWDYQARVEQRVGEGGLRLLVLGSSDAVGLSARDPKVQDDGGIGLLFHRVDLRGRHPFAGGEAEVGLTLGYDRLGLNFNKSGRDPGSYELTQGAVTLRTGYTRELSNALTVELFGQVERRSASLEASGTFRPQGPGDGRNVYDRPDILATFAGVGAQLTFKPTARWTLVPGLRLDSYHGFGLDTSVALEPRLAVRHALTDTLTLKTGAGLYHQPATVLLPVPAGEMLALERGLQRAVQVSAGAEWRPHPELEVSAEGYYNALPRTLEFNFEDVISNVRRRGLAAEDIQSHGHSYGVELMVRRPLGRRWFGWVTYGYNQSRRFERYTRLGANGEELGPAEGLLPYTFEQAHSANAALSYRFEFVTVGAVAHFNTGRPESGQFGYRTMRPGTNAEGQTDWVPVSRDAVDRLPSFFRLDLRASRSLVFENFLLDVYLDVFNVTARREVLYQDYEYGTSSGLPKGLKKTGFGLPVVLPTLGAKGTF
ncbi:TonB-dependent receptor domain-containing protein [Pyxidicoccus xibeiensis]|uniref:TonB-dependent receptor domain-containing protein n=1 Tax=Pyxidicoccus xibeiensis TaxID=2906759 RepID=UPI0020A80C62|nr:TonB-dependent receptor [Pyxidicoccus xibeiensis]MCP3142947.1 TonB-dependent receptor [Pyxidicoccus xibeiensis]